MAAAAPTERVYLTVVIDVHANPAYCGVGCSQLDTIPAGWFREARYVCRAYSDALGVVRESGSADKVRRHPFCQAEAKRKEPLR